MSRDPYELVRALLSKTVERGATEAEALSAKAKAEELIEKYKLDRNRVFNSPRRATSFDEAIRRAAEREWARRQKGKPRHKTTMSPAEVAEFLRQAFDHAKRQETDMAKKQKTKPTPKTTAKPKSATGGGEFRTVQECAEHFLKKGKTYEEVLSECKSHFKGAKTSIASVRWYASKLRKAGKL